MSVSDMGRTSLLQMSGRPAALCSKAFRSPLQSGSPQRQPSRRHHVSCQAAPPAKTALITGANSGIGLVAARELAKRGYNTVLACRDLQKAKDTKERIL